MKAAQSHAATLKAEAHMLSVAGFILLAIGLPLTLTLAWMALTPGVGLSPVLPAAAGGAPLMLGYLACHFASVRMARAKSLEG